MPTTAWQRAKQWLQAETRREKARQQALEDVLKKHPALGALAMVGVMACAWAPYLYFNALSSPPSVVIPPAPLYPTPVAPGAPTLIRSGAPLSSPALTQPLGVRPSYQEQARQLQAYGQHLNGLVQANDAYNRSMRTMVENHAAAILQVPPPMP